MYKLKYKLYYEIYSFQYINKLNYFTKTILPISYS